MDLKAILAGPQIRPRRIIIHGTEGIGKSSWAAKASRPIFLPTEEGLDNIDVPRFPLITSFQDLIDAAKVLYESDHKYETAVVDSLDALERIIWKQVCENESVVTLQKIGYGKGFDYALDYWAEFLQAMSALRDHRNMTVILIAHTGTERISNPEDTDYERFAPRVHKKASALLVEWADEVFFACYRQFVHKADAKDKKGKAVSTGERILRTVGRPSFAAKNRLNITEDLPLSWEAYAKYLPGQKDNGKEKKGKA